ncbi:hypothetical protein QBC41DRAFT_360597 [Cercophora samala]|uniref:Uncharacterized protein n=1 Tax=Cercophora samala TaxID=330535 RepID=A0AA39YTG3_9PEZI|nr:hypothetical protein QBC41DRAFT_360597 [Cercophora samala]
MLWGGESVGKFKDLTSKAQLLSKTSIEANWRQHLSQLLVPVSPSSQEVDFAVGQLRQSLEAFLHPATLTKNDRELDTVFRDAISLQASLALQTAWWYCEYPGPQRNRPPRGITFDDATMTGQQRTARSHANRVTLTISPALIKRGDSRGDDFSSERMVCQSEVVRGHSTNQMDGAGTWFYIGVLCI